MISCFVSKIVRFQCLKCHILENVHYKLILGHLRGVDKNCHLNFNTTHCGRWGEKQWKKFVTSCELRPKIWRWLCVVHKALNCTCYHRNHLWTSFGFVAGLYYQQTALENYSDSVNLVHCLVRLWFRYVQCVWSLYREDRQWCVVLVR